MRRLRVDWRSLRGRLLLALGLLSGLLGGTWVWRGWRTDTAELSADTRARLEALAAASSVALDGDLLQELRRGGADGPLAGPASNAADGSGGGSRTLRAVEDTLGALLEKAGLEGDLSLLFPRRSSIARLEAAPRQPLADALQLAASSSEALRSRQSVDWQPAMASALFEGRTSSGGPYPDPRGIGKGSRVLSAFAPLEDSFGGVAGLVRVDVPWSASLWAAALWMLGRIVVAAALVAGILFATDRLVRHSLRPLSALELAAGRLASGRWEEPIELATGTSELVVLASTLEALRRDVSARLEEERRTNQQLLESKRVLEGNRAATAEVLGRLGEETREPLERFTRGLRSLEGLGLEGAARQRIAQATQAGWNLARTVEHALQLARLEGTSARAVHERFDLAELIERAAGPARVRAAEQGLALRVVVPETLPGELLGDPGALGEVLSELLENALVATRSGSITLRVWRTAAREDEILLRFEVADTGSGIDAQTRTRIERALRERMDYVHTERHGHGLARSSELVHRHGGELAFESREGTGSRFWFFARFEPVARAQGGAQPQPSAALPGAGRVASPTRDQSRPRIQGAS